MELDKSQFFKTFEDVENYIESLRRQHNPLRKYDAHEAATYNKKLKSDSFRLPEGLKYYKITYICKHFGNRQSRSKGLRKRKPGMPCGCNYHIKFKYERLLQGYLVLSQNLTHNHEIGYEYYRQYADVRRLDPDLEQEVSEMLQSGIKPKELKKIMQEKTSNVVLTQDINNIRKRSLGKQGKALTQYDKYKRVTLLSHKIADAASELSDPDFRETVKSLEVILKCIQNKEALVIRENNTSQNENLYVSEESAAVASLQTETDLETVQEYYDEQNT